MPIKKNKFFIKTFGCIQNTADSERIKAFYWDKGYVETNDWKEADIVIINSCIIRESAENRVYGLINNVEKHNKNIKIIVTGCLSGLAKKDETGKTIRRLKREFGNIEFLPIEQISLQLEPLRDKKNAALIPISNGCNNFCSYCIVPFAKGREVSREFSEIIDEVNKAINDGFKEVVLIGQNVNSYGADLANGNYVSMGKKRFKSLFPKLLEEVAKKDLIKISFISSNPWDFSDELVEIIAKYKNIDRLIHLPIQAGNDEILKKMNRGYTTTEYLELVKKIRSQISDIRFSTDIIIGFPGESDEIFKKSIEIYKQANFEIAYLNKYSPRKGTVSEKLYQDDIKTSVKKERWNVLNGLINKKTK